MTDSICYVNNPRGQRLAFRYLSGKAPTVVFLSGYASDMQGSKAEFLAAHCGQIGQAFLRLDYSGHGQSQGRFIDGCIGDWADDAKVVLDHVGERSHILIGSSMGGWIMLLLALARSERIDALIGIASAPDFTEDLMWRSLTDAQRQTLQTEGQLVLPSDYVDDPFPITKRLIDDGRKQCLLDAAIDLRCPTRLIHGLRDADVPWQTSIKLAECLAADDVQVQIVKDGEHRLSRPSDLDLVKSTLDALLHG